MGDGVKAHGAYLLLPLETSPEPALFLLFLFKPSHQPPKAVAVVVGGCACR